MTNALIEAEHAKKMDIANMLLSLHPLNHPMQREDLGVDEASRVVGILAALQDKHVGAVSLCDIVNARDVCETIAEQGGVAVVRGHKSRYFETPRRRHGIAAAESLGWLMRDQCSTVMLKCWWYDAGSIARSTIRHGAVAQKLPIGVKGLEAMLHG